MWSGDGEKRDDARRLRETGESEAEAPGRTTTASSSVMTRFAVSCSLPEVTIVGLLALVLYVT